MQALLVGMLLGAGIAAGCQGKRMLQDASLLFLAGTSSASSELNLCLQQ